MNQRLNEMNFFFFFLNDSNFKFHCCCFGWNRRPSLDWRSSTKKTSSERCNASVRNTNATSSSCVHRCLPCRLHLRTRRWTCEVIVRCGGRRIRARSAGPRRKMNSSGVVWLSCARISCALTRWLARPTSWRKNCASRRALALLCKSHPPIWVPTASGSGSSVSRPSSCAGRANLIKSGH